MKRTRMYIQKELASQGVKSPLKSFVKKLNFQAVIFGIIFLTLNGYTYELFKKTNVIVSIFKKSTSVFHHQGL